MAFDPRKLSAGMMPAARQIGAPAQPVGRAMVQRDAEGEFVLPWGATATLSDNALGQIRQAAQSAIAGAFQTLEPLIRQMIREEIQATVRGIVREEIGQKHANGLSLEAGAAHNPATCPICIDGEAERLDRVNASKLDSAPN